MNTDKVTVLFVKDTRNGPDRSVAEVKEALKAGGEYYLAGMVNVPAEEGPWSSDDVMARLGWAYIRSQNEEYPNPGGQPARWNGLFAQRSSMAGDLFIIDGNIYLTKMIGFEWVAAEIILGELQLIDNPYEQPDSLFFGHPRC